MNSIQTNQTVLQRLEAFGLTNNAKIADSLQGSVWLSQRRSNKYVVKVTSKELHETSTILHNGKRYPVHENVKKEALILRHLTSHKNAPNTIVNYIDFIESDSHLYLWMEYGGTSLLDFVLQSHQLIVDDKLEIIEWQKCVRVIFKQLLNAIHHMHGNGVCHFDISLENTVISDVQVLVDIDGQNPDKPMAFCHDSIQIKVIDFGLAEFANKQGKNRSKFLYSKYCGKSNYKSPEVTAKKGRFDGRLNDIWCSGVCLWMMILGVSAFDTSALNDVAFEAIMNDEMIDLIDNWDRLDYITADIVHVFSIIFQYEAERASLKRLLNHHWVQQDD